MIRSSAGFLLALPIAATLTAVPAFAQYAPPPPPGAYYQERLPPVIGGYDDEEDLAPPPRNMILKLVRERFDARRWRPMKFATASPRCLLLLDFV